MLLANRVDDDTFFFFHNFSNNIIYLHPPLSFLTAKCLQAMLHLALPHVNIMSKFDLLKNYGQLGGFGGGG